MPFDGGSCFWMGEFVNGKSMLSGEGEKSLVQKAKT
jgi:hypothetical protein